MNLLKVSVLKKIPNSSTRKCDWRHQSRFLAKKTKFLARHSI